jgi:hypothetical protein
MSYAPVDSIEVVRAQAARAPISGSLHFSAARLTRPSTTVNRSARPVLCVTEWAANTDRNALAALLVVGLSGQLRDLDAERRGAGRDHGWRSSPLTLLDPARQRFGDVRPRREIHLPEFGLLAGGGDPVADRNGLITFTGSCNRFSGLPAQRVVPHWVLRDWPGDLCVSVWFWRRQALPLPGPLPAARPGDQPQSQRSNPPGS